MTSFCFQERKQYLSFGGLTYYNSWLNMKIEHAGIGGYGAAMFCGTGCFHRRESLGGKMYAKDYRGEWDIEAKRNANKTINELEDASKILASCSYEKNTQWGKKVCVCVCVCFFFNF